jgi:excisionase family DNA binding protein
MTTEISDFVYTVKESAALLKLSERSIRRYIRQGKLRAYRVAGTRELRILGRDLLQLLEPVENADDSPGDEHPPTTKGD